MAVQTIGYDNKVALNENPDIADINKVTDSDMNEIKSVVNENATSCGDLSNLNTTDKSSLVNAINEINIKEYGKVGLSTQPSITANNYLKTPYDYTFSISSGLTLTNDGGIKVSKSGYFLVIARTRLSSFSGTGYVAIRKNNENTNLVVNSVPKAGEPFEISTIVNLNANDTIYVYDFCSANANILGGGTPPVWVTLEVMNL